MTTETLDVADLDVVLVDEAPEALVLHDEGLIVGYAFLIRQRVIAIRFDGGEIIKTTVDRLPFWLDKLGADLGRPVAAPVDQL